MGSLFSERYMKGFKAPFYIQKVHIDFWTLVFNAFLMFGGTPVVAKGEEKLNMSISKMHIKF